MQEPKDGDFVAYIEALQRESAARLARQRASGADDPFAVTPPAGEPGQVPPGTSPPPTAASSAGFIRRDRGAKLVRAILASVIGAAFVLSWLGDGGPFAFIFGIALLAYGLPRVFAAVQAAGKVNNTKALVDHVFGRNGMPPRGTGK